MDGTEVYVQELLCTDTHDTQSCLFVGRKGQSGTNTEYPYGKGEYSLGSSTGFFFFFPTINVKERRGEKFGVEN